MLRYYPLYATINNLNTKGGELLLNKTSYTGKYYKTADGEFYSGPNPQTGPNEKLIEVKNYKATPGLNTIDVPFKLQESLSIKTNASIRVPGKPNSYYPQPTQEEYTRGYLIRYFTKKENDKGFIIEISEDEYNSILNGTADYDIRIYQVISILWKLTGPLNSQRKSQYNIIPGIIDTNKRLVETSNKNFLGIVEFIGEDYSKFARPTM
jgi:hypothetical protein